MKPICRCFLVLAVLSPGLAAGTHVIPRTQQRFDGNQEGVLPGDEILLQAGLRGALRIDAVHGRAGCPVIIRPEQGSVEVASTGPYALKIVDSTFFELTGLPNSGNVDEVRLSGGENALQVTGFSSDFAVRHLKIEKSRFAGVMIKLDPSDDPRTWRGAFAMRNVVVSDNSVSSTGAEGFYIGDSFYASGQRTASNHLRLPQAIIGLKVLHNHTFDTGCEGIQVGCATEGCEIADNTIDKFGQRPFGPYQNNGLQIGEGTGGICRNNVIRDGPGNGIIVLGLGGNDISGNRIERAGENGIYCQDVPPALGDKGYSIRDNIIVHSGADGIRLQAPHLPTHEIRGNLIIGAGSGQGVVVLPGVKAKLENNVVRDALSK